eukprot:1298853-Amphidinium_carterae.1
MEEAHRCVKWTQDVLQSALLLSATFYWGGYYLHKPVQAHVSKKDASLHQGTVIEMLATIMLHTP